MSAGNAISGKIKVFIADDSAFMRTALGRMIDSDPTMMVCGSAQSGQEALDKIGKLQPDVVTLDVEMPGLNGLETLKRIMRDSPRPVIMVSSLTQEGAETTLEALELGAFDYLPKQSSFVSLDIVKIRDDLIAKVKAAAESGKRRKMMPKVAPGAAKTAVPAKTAHHVPATMVALGTSTGGPKALQEILPMLPGDLAVPVVIVQHMPKGFTGPFARRLDTLCKVTVREAEQNDQLEAGTVYIAPAGQHLTFARRSANSKATIRLGPLPENSLHMPSVDVMMLSAAETFKSLCMGVILTGMGADGAKGMGAIQKEGGITVGQDEASCTVYGMPRSAAEMGVVQRVVPLQQVPEQIMQITHYKRRA
ncbi:MAG TPA: chemotaxis response regulator protein-glutamate methylesterase [Terriglobales bacterium]|jgi:two-component system chemotaxis response regulator CheB|nr:chemotaxis response regulator protein-glutamate methylesterase [Terriglobales bacterium]